MKLPTITKKKFIGAALAAGLALGMSGVAFAYFSTTATGNGDSDVGVMNANLGVYFANTFPITTSIEGITPACTGTNDATVGTLTPGQTVRQCFTIYNLTVSGSNPTHKNLKVAAATASVVATGTWIVTDTTSALVVGCHASWFTATATNTVTLHTTTVAIGKTITYGNAHRQVVTVSMSTTGTQNTCQNHQPRIKLTVTVHTAP